MTPNSPKREMEPASSLNERLGLSFSNVSLLTRALTHRSYANEQFEGVEDNERLEFLGDAVLDFIVGEWAYNRFPEMPEGDLTKIRSSLVRNERLAEFSRRLELGFALRLGRGEKSSGGHLRDNLLGSAFEALIGALYLDSGLEAVKRFMQPLLEWMSPSILDELHDPKSQLQEITQSLKLGTPHYRVINTSGPDHARMYEVEVEIASEVKGRGTGSSKSAAEHAGAKDALEKILNTKDTKYTKEEKKDLNL
ncbi:MAG: ribonuclease III [Anaerolineales bacterium]|nr:ribonuclease III [Anaerolineales bacterium]MDP2777114.1 ribonuclease III [Anaerolineales bacterium]